MVTVADPYAYGDPYGYGISGNSVLNPDIFRDPGTPFVPTTGSPLPGVAGGGVGGGYGGGGGAGGSAGGGSTGPVSVSVSVGQTSGQEQAQTATQQILKAAAPWLALGIAALVLVVQLVR